jgi:hypothetical protein
MSVSTSRFEKQDIVNSFNVFVDTEKANLVGHESSKGDDTHLHFEGSSVIANDGEMIRLSLQDFTMFNNIHMINGTNCRFQILGDGTAVNFNDVLFVDQKNYSNLKDIATAFADRLVSYLLGRATANGSTALSFEKTSVLPSSASMSSTDDRLLAITLTSKDSTSAVAHNLSNIRIQMKESLGDLYQIMGGNRQDDVTDTAFNSLSIFTTANTITISGFYPMQRMSDPYVYLRCSNNGNSLEMSVLQNDHAGTQNSDIVNSDILAKLHRHDEFISFSANTGLEYFINLQQKKLTNLRLFLTDSKGRKLGRIAVNRDSTGTGSGRATLALATTGAISGFENSGQGFLSNLQNTLGNLFFTCVLRLDIIRVSNPVKLESARLPAAKPAHRAQSVLTWADYGRPNTTPY